MVTLKELIDMNVWYGSPHTDEEIIVQYFMQNKNEDKGIELMAKLAKSKSDRLETRLAFINEWGLYAFSKSWVKSFGAEGAEVLNKYAMWFLLNCEPKVVSLTELKFVPSSEVPEHLLKQLKEIVPNHNRNKYVPFLSYALDYLHDLGLYFKNEKH